MDWGLFLLAVGAGAVGDAAVLLPFGLESVFGVESLKYSGLSETVSGFLGAPRAARRLLLPRSPPCPYCKTQGSRWGGVDRRRRAGHARRRASPTPARFLRSELGQIPGSLMAGSTLSFVLEELWDLSSSFSQPATKAFELRARVQVISQSAQLLRSLQPLDETALAATHALYRNALA